MAGQLTIDTLKTSSGVFSGQNAITGIANAWVNFNPNNPVVINKSYNVSSITRTGTGAFTITFTNAMADANYAACLSGRGAPATTNYYVENNDTIVRTTTQFAVYALGATVSPTDGDTKYSIAIFD
jgi:hypothetical protein